MPQQMWKHECAKFKSVVGTGSPVCHYCGARGEYDGWHRGMYESMARYQGWFGLKPVGPHRRMADELLATVTERCGSCDGRGLTDRAGGRGWEECRPCRGFGQVFTRPADEVRALIVRVLASYPEAAPDAPLPDAGWQRDVLELLPPPADVVELERVLRLKSPQRPQPDR
jgi:hypothetical protein